MSMDDPDWKSIQVRGRAMDTASTPLHVGDPTRWGGNATLTVTIGAGTSSAIVEAPQVVRAQTSDAYARPWWLTGTIELNDAFAKPTTGLLILGLDVQSGAGQDMVWQRLDLRDPIFNPQPRYSSIFIGGIRSFTIPPVRFVAQALSARFRMQASNADAVAIVATATVRLLLTPQSIGDGA